jgi:predicted amidohydrolase
MNKVMTKQLVLGFALGIVVATAVAATVAGKAEIGRFQIGATHSHAFVIDTQTGQVWREDASGFSSVKAKVPAL